MDRSLSVLTGRSPAERRQLQLAADESPSVALALATSQQMGFPLRILGQTATPITPQPVGDWWLEPLTAQTRLPARAQQRLNALLAAGVKPRGLALFHELPASRQQALVPSRGIVVWRWAKAHLPMVGDLMLRAGRRSAPILGGLLLAVLIAGVAVAVGALLAFVIATVVSFVIGVLVAVVAAVAALAAAVLAIVGVLAAAALALDPCLVLVTEEGYWIEVDRWDS